MPGPRPVALDHNFPEHVRALARLMPEVTLRWVRDLPRAPDGTALPDLDDHDLIFELHRMGFGIMATNNYKMAQDARVLVAIDQTRMTLLTIQGAGDDPILATGVLLRDLVPIARSDVHKGAIYPAKSSSIRPQYSRALLAKRSEELGTTVAELVGDHGRPFTERSRFPPGDPRRVV